MYYLTGTLTSTTGQYHKDLLKILFDALCNANMISDIEYGASNVGDGELGSLEVGEDGLTEDWTLACTSGGAGAEFSVVGSITGALSSATAETAYSDGVLSFTISEGATEWAIGDTIEFSVTRTMGDEVWTRLRTEEGAGEWEYIARGKGDGSNQIYIGAETLTSVGSYFNWSLETLTGYGEGFSLHNQPGAFGANTLRCLLTNNPAMQYWFVLDGFCAIGFIKVETYYECFYLGWYDRFGIASQFPFPAIIGASAFNVNLRSDTGDNHQAFFSSRTITTTSPTLAMLNGTWQRNVVHMFPYNSNDSTLADFRDIRPVAGNPSVFDCILFSLNTQMFGALRNLKYVSGNGVSSESEFSCNGSIYKVFPNVFRLTSNSYIAMRIS